MIMDGGNMTEGCSSSPTDGKKQVEGLTMFIDMPASGPGNVPRRIRIGEDRYEAVKELKIQNKESSLGAILIITGNLLSLWVTRLF